MHFILTKSVLPVSTKQCSKALKFTKPKPHYLITYVTACFSSDIHLLPSTHIDAYIYLCL